MVVILRVPSVGFLLQVSPATHVLQALGRVPNLYQTHGLQSHRGEKTHQELFIKSVVNFFPKFFRHLAKYPISITSLFLIRRYLHFRSKFYWTKTARK